MGRLCALFASPARTIALAVGVLWVALGGFWPVALRPRTSWVLAGGVVIATAAHIAIQTLAPAGAA